ncbi:GtrA family protein [Paenibacillus eucommiae]|uniref:Flippase GtrA n=1 Tax=Paenibacillus eucommiae TaxID=1355755 RepID=A0ABS4J228_9BACL|nr:GtrA family protein [Paenibacillus eucommiae]MBP1993891.1 putative flippase GtrA [Paenibacillus eucommiae]
MTAAGSSWYKSSFARFLLVGILNTLVGLGLSFVLYNVLHLGYWPSTFLGNTIGAAFSFVLNRSFTFRSKVSVQNSWWKFALVILCCYGFSYGTSLLLGNLWSSLFPSTNQTWVHNAAILFGNGMYTISNYLGHKYFTFRTPALPAKELSVSSLERGRGSDR